jgi:hypothetical protein
MRLATTPANAMETPERAETIEAPLVLVLVELEVAPVVVCEVELLVGVKGAVKPYPGSLEFGTLAANAAKVLLPVVGGLIAPYMPLWQWGFLAQKNQIGLVVCVTSRVKTPICPLVDEKGMKGEEKPFCCVTVLNCCVHGLANELWVTV